MVPRHESFIRLLLLETRAHALRCLLQCSCSRPRCPVRMLFRRWIMDITLRWQNRRAMHSQPACAAAVGLKTLLPTSLDGLHAPAMSHRRPSEVGHPMGGSISSIGDVAERPLKERVKFITTSSSLRGPTSSISTTSLSCQHIDDLSSIALGLQICGHPLSSGCPIPSRQAEGQHIASRQTAS